MKKTKYTNSIKIGEFSYELDVNRDYIASDKNLEQIYFDTIEDAIENCPKKNDNVSDFFELDEKGDADEIEYISNNSDESYFFVNQVDFECECSEIDNCECIEDHVADMKEICIVYESKFINTDKSDKLKLMHYNSCSNLHKTAIDILFQKLNLNTTSKINFFLEKVNLGELEETLQNGFLCESDYKCYIADIYNNFFTEFLIGNDICIEQAEDEDDDDDDDILDKKNEIVLLNLEKYYKSVLTKL